jgi:hypothetical protein
LPGTAGGFESLREEMEKRFLSDEKRPPFLAGAGVAEA